MRIVIGTSALANAAGTETYVALVARELQRLGHDVVVTAEQFGAMADHIEQQGVVLARTAAELPAACDAILSNDGPSTASLAARYPGTRLVHVSHSDLFDHQLPVLVPGVVDAVVVCSDRFAARVRALALDVPIVRLRLPVDADRFVGSGPLPERPRRALIVSNYLAGERRSALVDAWSEQGVTCTQIGVLSRVELDPAPAMRTADIVVAKAGAALEGMACGRAVYVYDQFGGDGWVTPASYAALEADNLAGLSSPTPRTPAQLAADLADYDPQMGWLNAELVRTHHASRRHAQELVDVLRGEHAGEPAAATALGEIARLTRIAWGADRRAIGAHQELIVLRERVLAAEAQVTENERTSRERDEQFRSAENAGHELAAWTTRAENAERELAAWTMRAERAEAGIAGSTIRAENADRELAAWTARAENAERELAAWTARAENADRELAAWTARAENAERELAAWTARAENADRELAAWTARAENAERELAAWTARAERAETGGAAARAEAAGSREQALQAERELGQARRLLATSRVRIGLRAGRALDRVRGRG